jgi:hypothetical protein
VFDQALKEFQSEARRSRAPAAGAAGAAEPGGRCAALDFDEAAQTGDQREAEEAALQAVVGMVAGAVVIGGVAAAAGGWWW